MSPTLRRYHQILWSKPLPSGAIFGLSISAPRVYLHHRSELGEFFLSSDTVIPTFTLWPAMKPITEQLPEWKNAEFRTMQYTIGGMMVWPGNRIDGKQTINQDRGFQHRIKDRMDLTLECIRRHYLGQPSPLGDTLARYRDFFAFFDDFGGYVDFFLLQDMVTADRSAVNSSCRSTTSALRRSPETWTPTGVPTNCPSNSFRLVTGRIAKLAIG